MSLAISDSSPVRRLARSDEPNAERRTSGTAITHERDREAGQLAGQPSLLLRASQLWKHGHPDRLRGDHDHDEEPVGREQPVGRLGAPELARDHDADRGGDRRTRAETTPP